MNRGIVKNSGRFVIIMTLIIELGIIIGLASILWILKDGTYIMCCRKSTFLMSYAFVCAFGVEVFSTLDNNRWRIKLSNKEFPVYKAIFLIILNVLVFLLTGIKERTYLLLIVPVILWGMLILINRIRRFFRS